MNTSDPLFVVDPEAKRYMPISVDVVRDIASGKLRV
jgi:hypothetical protein